MNNVLNLVIEKRRFEYMFDLYQMVLNVFFNVVLFIIKYFVLDFGFGQIVSLKVGSIDFFFFFCLNGKLGMGGKFVLGMISYMLY